MGTTKEMIKKVLAMLGLLAALTLWGLIFDWFLFQSGTFFTGHDVIIEWVPSLGEISFWILFAITIRGCLSIFQSFEPIPKDLYEHWPKPVKILATIIIVILLGFVIPGLAVEFLRSGKYPTFLD